MLQGKWYEIGTSKDFRQCECPSVYPLPDPTPGTEQEYDAMQAAGTLPTHVHKTSCDGDWWQIGTYTAGPPKVLGTFLTRPGEPGPRQRHRRPPPGARDRGGGVWSDSVTQTLAGPVSAVSKKRLILQPYV